MNPYFVLHYARVAGGAYVHRFFTDLQDQVYDRLGRRAAFTGVAYAAGAAPAPGARARGTSAPESARRGGGVEDRGEPVDASPEILASPAMVALYTDDYLRDERCLLEWALFRERVRSYEQITGRSTPALIGVRWAAPGVSLPGAVAEAGVLDGAFGERYRDGGALRLIRTDPLSADYRALVSRVVDAIITASDDAIRPMPAPEVGYVRPPLPAPAPRDDPLAASTVVGLVLCAVAAADQPAWRVDRRHYGSTALSWRPFLPETAWTAFEITRAGLVEHGIADAVHPLDDEARAFLAASERRRVLIVLVDPWIVDSGAHASVLTRLARWRESEPRLAGTVVIMSRADLETAANADRLTRRLAETLRGAATGHPEIGSGSVPWSTAVDADTLVARTIPLVIRALNAELGQPTRRPPEGPPPGPSLRPSLRPSTGPVDPSSNVTVVGTADAPAGGGAPGGGESGSAATNAPGDELSSDGARPLGGRTGRQADRRWRISDPGHSARPILRRSWRLPGSDDD